MALVVKNVVANAGDTGSTLRSGRSPKVGNHNPLQYSCLENSRGRGAWWAIGHRIAKSWTHLSTTKTTRWEICYVEISKSNCSFYTSPKLLWMKNKRPGSSRQKGSPEVSNKHTIKFQKYAGHVLEAHCERNSPSPVPPGKWQRTHADTCLFLVAVQWLNHVWLFGTPWTAALQVPCPSPSPRVCSNSCPLSRWCHPTISSSVTPFSSCPQSFPASGSFPKSWLFMPTKNYQSSLAQGDKRGFRQLAWSLPKHFQIIW